MTKGNSNIVMLGVATQFGKERGPDPSASAKKKNAEQHAQSIRLALRRLMEFEIDFTASLTPQVLCKAFNRQGGQLTIAQACAVRMVHYAMTNPQAMDRLIEHVDGKQVQPVAAARLTLEQLVAASYDPHVLNQPVEDENASK